MERGGWVYIISNKNKTVLYTGVTSNLRQRIWEHQHKSHPSSFTAKYNVDILVYYAGFHYIEEAIAYEKKIKSASRMKKEQLIAAINPLWENLSSKLDEETL